MKRTTISFAACTLLLFAACKGKKTVEEPLEVTPPEELVVEKGEIQGDSVYLNKKPAFSFSIDTSWHVLSEQELTAMQQKAARFIEGKAVLDGTQSVVVFMSKQFETGLPLDINDSFMCSVNGHDIGAEHFDDAADYFDYMKRMYRTMLPADMVSRMEYKPASTETINGKKLEMLEMEIKLDEEKSLVERHYVYIDKNYILDFAIKFSPQEEHDAVMKMLNSISVN